MRAGAFLGRLWRDRSGVAAAEMILILPLATFMVFATVEAGHFMYTEHEVMKSVRDAARWGSRQPLSAFGCTATSADAALPSDTSTLGTIRTNISTLARYGQLSTDAPLLVAGWQDSDITVTYACEQVNATASDSGIYTGTAGYAPRITVVGTPSYPTLFGTMAAFPATMKLFAKQQAVVAGV